MIGMRYGSSEMHEIYTLTTIRNKAWDTDTRCVGWFPNYEDAESTIIRSGELLNEAGYYEYAVIECIKAGIYQYDDNPAWFAYNYNLETYGKIERPEDFEHVCGFGIG